MAAPHLVHAPGSAVEIGPADNPIRGEIAQVTIGQRLGTHYQVSWWNGRTRLTEWIPAAGVRAALEPRQRYLQIGFTNGRQDR